MISIASTSSLTRIAPSWATMPPPTLAATMKPKMNGTISRLTQNELNSGPTIAGADRLADRLGGDPAAAPATNADEHDHEHAAGDEQPDLAQHLGGELRQEAEAAEARAGRTPRTRPRRRSAARARGLDRVVSGRPEPPAAAWSAGERSSAEVHLREERLEELRVDDRDDRRSTTRAGDDRLVDRLADALGAAAAPACPCRRR